MKERPVKRFKKTLMTGEVAKLLDCSPDEVRRLENDGELVAGRTRGKHRRFARDTVDAYKRRRLSRSHPPSLDQKPQLRLRRALPSQGEDIPPDSVDDLEALQALADAHPLPPPPPPPLSAIDALRLQTLRIQGLVAIPFNAPPSWRQRVEAELERFVTVERFPALQSPLVAYEIVTARVQEVLQPYREEVAQQAARDDAAQHDVQALITYGRDHARHATDDWEVQARWKAQSDVDRILKAEVTASMTQREIRQLVDEILDRYPEERDEEEDE